MTTLAAFAAATVLGVLLLIASIAGIAYALAGIVAALEEAMDDE